MKNVRRNILCNALIIAIGVAGTAPNAQAQVAGNMKTFNVPAQSAAAALNAFAEQADITLVFSKDRVANITTHPLQGSYRTLDGLQAMLEGSGLAIRQVNDNSISIGDETVPRDAEQRAAKKSSENSDTLDTVTVTGTRIRGGTTPSPVVVVGSKQIAEEGFSDLGEVARSLPQNFSGGQNPGVAEGAQRGGPANYNTTGGSALDLRGLGPDATLTLLNGHRLSYGGTMQSVDISTIPIDAVERLEIVPDGASAIYGSDAVGGVANVILKRDFDGVTVGTRYGSATEGGLTTREYTATAGTAWSTGGLIATWKKESNDPIYSDQRDYTQSMYRPSTLYQGSDLRSGLLSLHQSLGDSVELRLDALKSERSSFTNSGSSSYFLNAAPETNAISIAPSLELSLPNDWTLTLGAALGKEKMYRNLSLVFAAAGTTRYEYAYSNKSTTYEIGAEGRLFTLPGGDARLAVGAGYRSNDFLYSSISPNSIYADGDESSRFAYAELSVPLIAPEQDIRGVERLMVTGAVRTEDYDSYGRVTTPKIGLVYSPSADFTLKTSWGKSFKAPTLLQQYSIQAIYLASPVNYGGRGYPADATVLLRYGGNTDLRPERARTWSTSLAFHPEKLPGLETELTWFDIDYTNRIVTPASSGADMLSNPIYAAFIDYYPTEAEQAEAINASTFQSYVSAPYDASKVVAIFDNRYVNAARQKIKGIDLSESYRFDVGAGQLTLRGSASWLDSRQALTTAQSLYDLSGRLFYPAKFNARVGAVWGQGALPPPSSAITGAAWKTRRMGRREPRSPPSTARCVTTPVSAITCSRIRHGNCPRRTCSIGHRRYMQKPRESIPHTTRPTIRPWAGF